MVESKRTMITRSRAMMMAMGTSLLCLSSMAPPALASDGVLEINQACAEIGGCFPGDAPGFPVSIDSTAGATSLRLTSDLVIPSPSMSAIVVVADDITIDLGGFRIVAAACVPAGSGSSCVPPGAGGYGILGAGFRGLSIRNGSIVGMGADGIRSGDDALVDDVASRFNREDGLDLGDGARVIRVKAVQNGESGVSVGIASLVADSVIASNVDIGVEVPDGASTLRDLSVHGNGGAGILATQSVVRNVSAIDNGSSGATEVAQVGIRCERGCVFERVRVEENQSDGLSCGEECIFRRVTASENGDDGIACSRVCSVSDSEIRLNGGDGVVALNGSRVWGNVITDNGDDGLQGTSSAAYQDNVFSGNADVAVTSGVNLGGNLCDGVLCP